MDIGFFQKFDVGRQIVVRRAVGWPVGSLVVDGLAVDSLVVDNQTADSLVDGLAVGSRIVDIQIVDSSMMVAPDRIDEDSLRLEDFDNW